MDKQLRYIAEQMNWDYTNDGKTMKPKKGKNIRLKREFESWLRQKWLVCEKAIDLEVPEKYSAFLDENIAKECGLPVYYITENSISIAPTYYELFAHESKR